MAKVLTSQTDEALMARVAHGRHDAFEVLLTRYEGAVTTFCYSFVRDFSLAEDLAQETFLRVFRSAKRYRPQAKFSTWLYKIAANLCINALKKGKLRQALSLDAPVGMDEDGAKILEKFAGDDPQPVNEVQNRELQGIIRAAIDRLPEEQRTTLIMVEYHHLSYKEIADILDVTVSAIKMRIKRARENLRETLKGLEHHLRDQ
jgi:RNA polymerase sigma-70 factor (ECF subfamily)